MTEEERQASIKSNRKFSFIINFVGFGGAILKNESKRDKFVRIAEARTNKIINMIQLLGNCSNQGLYEYSKMDVDAMFNAIQTELDEAKQRYSKQDSQYSSKFMFKL